MIGGPPSLGNGDRSAGQQQDDSGAGLGRAGREIGDDAQQNVQSGRNQHAGGEGVTKPGACGGTRAGQYDNAGNAQGRRNGASNRLRRRGSDRVEARREAGWRQQADRRQQQDRRQQGELRAVALWACGDRHHGKPDREADAVRGQQRQGGAGKTQRGLAQFGRRAGRRRG